MRVLRAVTNVYMAVWLAATVVVLVVGFAALIVACVMGLLLQYVTVVVDGPALGVVYIIVRQESI